jgi:murein DD-endopeptidase MepM/ murein hydrolase activator NlpD
MKKLRIFLVVVALCLPCSARASDAPVSKKPKIAISPASPGPGDIMIVTVKGADGEVEGAFHGRKIYFNPSKKSRLAVIGIDLNTEPGKYNIEILINGRKYSRTIAIAAKKYPVQRLTLPKDMVELTPENEARVEREQQKVAALWPRENGRLWDSDFINPRDGKISTRFGFRRIINGIPKNPHSGVDVAADEGQDVYAPNNGVVAMVDDHFFSGNSLILDHGQGIYTMFFHLSKILVTEGQQVKKGDVIALVGSTGRSTGAHLHWGVRIQGARVDPQALIKLKLE